MRTISSIFLASMLLAGAALPAVAATAHGVPWYLANAASRNATVAICQADPGDLAATADCINAAAAAKDAALAAL
jgi:hypothetical protein